MGGEPSRGQAMTRIYWWLADALSRTLAPDERDAVCGDLAETGKSGGQGLRDVLSLVVRLQLALWSEWRPWVALVGLVVPLGMLLSLVSLRTADSSAIYIWLHANWDWDLLKSVILPNAMFRHDLVSTVVSVFLSFVILLCWSWTSGFVLGSVSRRTIPVNGALFCLVLLLGELLGPPRFLGHSLFLTRARDFDVNAAVFTAPFYRVILPLLVLTVLVLLPSLWGMREGILLASRRLLLQKILCAGATVTFAAIVIQSWAWWWFLNRYTRPAIWSGWQMTLLQAVAYWPIAYAIATASWRRWRHVSTLMLMSALIALSGTTDVQAAAQVNFQYSTKDYPQWRGQNRDGSASAFSEPKTWPEKLIQKWKVEVGEGYATPSRRRPHGLFVLQARWG
jgi:hypothetical protein